MEGDPTTGTFWRHLPSGELYRVVLIAVNPNSGERQIVFLQPRAADFYYCRPVSEFLKRFTREKEL